MKYQKNSFVVVPNKNILRRQKPIVLAVYFWICNYVDRNDDCFPSIKTIAFDCNSSESSVKEAMRILSNLRILKKKIRKNNKLNLTNLYHVEIIENPYFLEGVGQEVPQLGQEVPSNSNQLTLINTPSVSSETSGNVISEEKKEAIQEPFSMKKTIQILLDAGDTIPGKRHDGLIGLFWKAKQFDFKTKEQYQLRYKRDLKIAKELADSGYSNTEIAETMHYCRDKFETWTLETVAKRIQDVVRVREEF